MAPTRVAEQSVWHDAHLLGTPTLQALPDKMQHADVVPSSFLCLIRQRTPHVAVPSALPALCSSLFSVCISPPCAAPATYPPRRAGPAAWRPGWAAPGG